MKLKALLFAALIFCFSFANSANANNCKDKTGITFFSDNGTEIRVGNMTYVAKNNSLTKYSENGEVIWNQNFTHSQPMQFALVGFNPVTENLMVSFSAFGGYYRSTTYDGQIIHLPLEYSSVLAAIDTDGKIKWHVFLGQNDPITFPSWIKVLNDSKGNIYVIYSTIQNLPANAVRTGELLKFNPSGALSWNFNVYTGVFDSFVAREVQNVFIKNDEIKIHVSISTVGTVFWNSKYETHESGCHEAVMDINKILSSVVKL